MNQQLTRPDIEADASGMDLFRRAICERDDEAWTTVVEQYRGIVLAAIRRHSASHQLHEDDIYWINRAFQRFWAAVGPDRFGQFTELPAILGYLKMCAVSVLLDDLRALRRCQFAPIDETSPECAVEPDHGDVVSDRLDAAALWAAVLETLVSDTERLVARLSFVGGLSPREIFARHDDCFANVGDVYRVKRNLLERLRNKRGLNKHRAPANAPPRSSRGRVSR